MKLTLKEINKQNIVFKIYFYWFIFLMLFDLFTTYIWINYTGAKEGNWLMHYIVHNHFWIAIVIKIISIIIVTIIIEKKIKNSKNKQDIKKTLYLIMFIFYFYLFVQVNNIWVILAHLQNFIN